jgi:hypothetical protein
MGRILTLIVILTLVLSATAAADEPLQEWRHIDITAKAAAASALCGFTIFRHLEGDSHFIVFYDNDGAIVREVDTFPSLKITLYAPSTGQSYTSSEPAAFRTYYTNGAAIGSEATAILTGLIEKFGSADLDSGRLVFRSHVVGYDAAGVPLISGFEEISSVGPNVDVSTAQSRCDGVRSQ